MNHPSRIDAPSVAPVAGMIWVPGGRFRMGSDSHYPEERPAHDVVVDGFWMDRHPVTNRQFARFVEATGHVTCAETPPTPAEHASNDATTLYAGSRVFVQPRGPVHQHDVRNWWTFMRGAMWRAPAGPATSIADRHDHPVVHVTYGDAEAYAAWAGKSIPTEAEWEFAARGGLDGAEYAWGDDLHPHGRAVANIWQGEFPWQNFRDDGYVGTSPVGAFPPNGYGLYDMIGNVWEWTSDWYVSRHLGAADADGLSRNPRGPRREDSFDPCQPGLEIPRKVLKGGSHLSAPNYCRRYRPAGRYPETVDTSTSHVGFRCIARAPGGSGH